MLVIVIGRYDYDYDYDYEDDHDYEEKKTARSVVLHWLRLLAQRRPTEIGQCHC